MRKPRPSNASPAWIEAVKILVKIIGPLMYAAGFSEKDVDVPDGTTVESLIDSLGIPKDRPRIVTRNGSAAAPGEPLAAGDTIAVSPIYSGG
jgi:molybdopterin converting factor small subunit